MAEFMKPKKDFLSRGLPLVDGQVTPYVLGQQVAELFDANSSLLGISLIQANQLAGYVSRRRFHERISSSYERDFLSSYQYFLASTFWCAKVN